MAPSPQAQIGIIGGSGFYSLAANLTETKIQTPFGPPSDQIALGTIAGKKVAFLPRHHKNHDLPPHQINYRANLWALHSLGVKEILTVTACGSLQPHLKPGDFVILDQFIDRTKGRIDTYYDGSIVTHISSAFPYCTRLNQHALKHAKRLHLPVHPRGTAVVINGPRFSTAAESSWFTKMNWDIVNMTQYPEVVLAQELALCYTALAVVTDYDAGLISQTHLKPVSARQVIKIFNANITSAKKLILSMISSWPKNRSCSCRRSLDHARFS